MKNWGHNLNLWEKVMEKVVNIKAKTSLQPLLRIKEIDSRCPKSYKSTAKDKSSQDYWNRNNAKSSHNSPPINAS